MRATGIVRRIDDLGRVVIPKEIRRTMRIREGDPLEIFTDTQGEVIFKKYSQLGEMSLMAADYTDCLYKNISMPVLITDRDSVVSCAGIQKKEAIGRRNTQALEDIMENRTPFISSNKDDKLQAIEGLEKKAILAFPIISSGDVAGSIILLENENFMLSSTETRLLQVAASFLGKQMEE